MQGIEEYEYKVDKKEISHFAHPQHLLTYISEMYLSTHNCIGCAKTIYSKAFCCSQCDFWLHDVCAQHPQTLNHPFHVPHPLTLLDISSHSNKWFLCFSCGVIKEGFTYNCCHTDCQGFDLCLPCCVKSVKDLNHDKRKQLKLIYFGHKHSLLPRDFNKAKEMCRCVACLYPMEGLGYRCSKDCKFFIHVSCAQVPMEVPHYCHPEHPLTLLTEPPYESKEFRCNACRKVCSGYTYHCGECHYNLDIRCAALEPSVKHERHEHMLVHFTEVGLDVQCFACNLPCKTDLYRCVACNFNIHTGCVSLPSSVIHPRDDHPLVLTPVYLGDDTGLGEYYCDVCEQPRNPDRGVYVCEKCVFVAHIECVIPNSKVQVNPYTEKFTTTLTTDKGETKQGNIVSKVEYAELDLEIGKLHQEMEALNAKFCLEIEKFNVEMMTIKTKFRALEEKHVQYVASSASTSTDHNKK